MLPDLSELLTYRHPQVIKSYKRNFQVEEDQAVDLFQDMLKYLWLVIKHQQERQQQPLNPALDFSLVMHQEMRPIDEMWHNFILYTKDYQDFCQHYFGQFIHHYPDIAEHSVPVEHEFSVELEKYLIYLYENLGEETVLRWFAQHFQAGAIREVA